ncbi:MAG: anthranilate phosphoribosyltransferase, partial [Alphaproteobacteria bacterium]
NIKELQGFDPKNNAQKLLALLNGEKSAYRDIVILNSAFAFLLSKKVADITEGIKLAEEIIDQKIALAVLHSLQNNI